MTQPREENDMPINRLDAEAITAFKAYGNMDTYQTVSSGSAIYPGIGTNLGLIYCALKLNGEAGELAEHVGKAMRDDSLMVYGELTEERHKLITKELGDCLWYIAAIARELNLSLVQVAGTNLDKLFDRQQRNALQGSGDNR
jgi:NTP pyrophosphatase (non-canonical NTP hydrolase)